MGRKKLMYVAGPISRGEVWLNVRLAHSAGMALLKMGYAVIVPHGSCFWGNQCLGKPPGVSYMPEAFPAGTSHADWMASDLEIARRCDAVYRSPGESGGADAEVALARELGLPVFHSLLDAAAWLEGHGHFSADNREAS
jgi:hypothetical protein